MTALSSNSGATEAQAEVVLSLQGVHKRFGDLEVLKGIDLTVRSREVVCLIGSSGSGKSTLLRTCNLLEPIDAGTIELLGHDLGHERIDPDAVRRHIGMVFQSYNLFAPRRVLKRSKAAAELEATELLARIGLAEKAADFPDRLSGGQQQRVAIVRALAMGPSILLLDEITSALDPELVAEVLGLVEELAQQGMTMVLATHEMGFAKEVADTVCFLEEGRIIESGPPGKIFEDPDDPATRRFLQRIIEAGRL